jgi:hypothetical protein
MGTYHYAIVERKPPSSKHWWFTSFWDLGKCYELAAAVQELKPSTGPYSKWPCELGLTEPDNCSLLSRALGEHNFWKTELTRAELPAMMPDYPPEYASLLASLTDLTGEVRVLFCQDQ